MEISVVALLSRVLVGPASSSPPEWGFSSPREWGFSSPQEWGRYGYGGQCCSTPLESDVRSGRYEALDSLMAACYHMKGGNRVSVLGRPQHDWDDFLEEASKPKRKWRLSRILWLLIAIAVSAVVIVYYYKEYGG